RRGHRRRLLPARLRPDGAADRRPGQRHRGRLHRDAAADPGGRPAGRAAAARAGGGRRRVRHRREGAPVMLTFHPTLPIVVIVVGVLALGLCVWQLVAARGRRLAWIRRALLVLLAVAMAFRPALPGGEVPTASIQARVFVMIDTSQSVAAEDWGAEPRLTGMQAEVVESARSFAGADISVISFDSQASLRVPLTDDGSAVIEMVRALRPEIAQQSRGTSIAVAHDLLRTELERSEADDPASPAVVFYLGDGEHTAEDEPQSFDDLAGQIDRGLVLGYGTEQG